MFLLCLHYKYNKLSEAGVPLYITRPPGGTQANLLDKRSDLCIYFIGNTSTLYIEKIYSVFAFIQANKTLNFNNLKTGILIPHNRNVHYREYHTLFIFLGA